MPKTPLLQSDLEAIDAAQRALQDLIPVIVHAERCGQDCNAFKQRAEALLKRLSAFAQSFRPGGDYEQGII